jgi:hypothetical protein
MSYITIQLRRDTSTNWTNINPILALGEPGLETDTNLIKYGDGVTYWNNLIYSSSTSGFSGISGNAGYSGFSGNPGMSGFSGIMGISGISGATGGPIIYNLDGGSAYSVYSSNQQFDAGSATSIYTTSQIIDGGDS